MTRLTTDPGYQLTYIATHEAYYARDDQERTLNVVKAADAGGCAWEFNIVDHSERLDTAAVRVEIFDDAWQAFAEIPDLFAALAEIGESSLDEVRQILDQLGFTDATERVSRDRT